MWRFILEVFVFTVISMFCLSMFGQGWQDEEHVWDEEKQKWVVKNKAGGRIDENGAVGGFLSDTERPYYGQPWERYLSRNVKYGKREATPWELEEAKRKLWAKQVLIQRAIKRAEGRRQLIASRKASGWYSSRSSNAFAPSPALRYHMRASGYGY